MDFRKKSVKRSKGVIFNLLCTTSIFALDIDMIDKYLHK